MSEILDGKKVSAFLRAELKKKVDCLKSGGREATLAVLLIGEDSASRIYVRNKIKACEEVGIKSRSYFLPADTSEEKAEMLVSSLASDSAVDGILVQLPLPPHLNKKKILSLIPAEKDVDGFSPVNIGRLAIGEKGFVPCTPYGIMALLSYYKIDVNGKRAVVIGRSNIVGKPMGMLLLNANATVTICHSRTEKLRDICLQADILISAVGKAGFVGADMVKEGAAVIDVGMNRNGEGKLCGDVDFAAVKDKASYITPVPGGVGPMTITMLMYNTYRAAAGEDFSDVF